MAATTYTSIHVKKLSTVLSNARDNEVIIILIRAHHSTEMNTWYVQHEDVQSKRLRGRHQPCNCASYLDVPHQTLR